jgi:hypothetical protein
MSGTSKLTTVLIATTLNHLHPIRHLEWQLNVDPSTLHDFQPRVQQDFARPGP